MSSSAYGLPPKITIRVLCRVCGTLNNPEDRHACMPIVASPPVLTYNCGAGNPALQPSAAEFERDQALRALNVVTALNALAATLALVPRERVCWVVKCGRYYLAYNAAAGGYYRSLVQKLAHRFESRSAAENECQGTEHVVRLRTRRAP